MTQSHEEDKLYALTMRLLGRFRTLMETLMIRKTTDAEYPFVHSGEGEDAQSDERFKEVRPLFIAEADVRPNRGADMKNASSRIQQLLARILPVSSKRVQ